MNSMSEEVTGEHVFIMGNEWHPVILTMENESMEKIFSEGPWQHTDQEGKQNCHWVEAEVDVVGLVGGVSSPRNVGSWNMPVRSLTDSFQEQIIEQNEVFHWVNEMFWLVNVG